MHNSIFKPKKSSIMTSILLFSLAQQWNNFVGQPLVIVVGILVGLLVGLAMRWWRSLGMLFSSLVGMLGALLNFFFLNHKYTFSTNGKTNDMIYAALAAFLLSFICNALWGSNKGRDRTWWRA